MTLLKPVTALVLLTVALTGAACTTTEKEQPMTSSPPGSPALGDVAPALGNYTDTTIAELWNRPGLAPRERSLVTVAALIAAGQDAELAAQTERALANGLTAVELSETITHLAFYSGWPNATAAAAAIEPVFRAHGVNADQLPAIDPPLLPQDAEAEASRAAGVEANFGTTAPGVVQYTTDTLFGDLWLRPGLAPRDRSLVTYAALVATGQVAQITYHLGRALDNGLTNTEASEVLTQLAFYSGWPLVFSAMPVVKDALATR